MTPELMDMLRNERMRLEAELKAMTTYRRLEAVLAMIEAYDDPPPAVQSFDAWEAAKKAAGPILKPVDADPVEPEIAPPASVEDQIVGAIAAAGAAGISAVHLLHDIRIGYDPMLRHLKALTLAGRITKVNNGTNGTVYVAAPQQGDDAPSERIERTLGDAGEAGIKATALRGVSGLEPISFKAMMDAMVAEGAVKRAGDRYYRIVPLQPNGAQG